MGGTVCVVLIRHGLTSYNKEKRYLGHTNLSLLEKERSRLDSLKSWCEKMKLDQLYSSDLNRCIETSSLLFPDQNPVLMSSLREYDFGDWEGKQYRDLADLPHYQNWIANPRTITPPNGECFQDFKNRIEQGFNQLLNDASRNKHSTVVCVTHGGVIRYLLSEYAPNLMPFNEWTADIGKAYKLTGDIVDVRRGQRFSLLQVVPSVVKTNG
ncbi:histidine phosphatase family protein [Alkalihalophilus pseudofirmus]|uniref:Histidine phosphatase family protein n=1 Tax=Alkalihalophilus pseudofirmus TaxID=79885 RepID=A0AAJ2NKF9_ALKPS|nr:histidine phosphatase family protein [Alkalihalophilus pseudofirmus]MDV2884269.1 histidine phosphatase family protein [Alkalihalophilus pseudofirmus]